MTIERSFKDRISAARGLRVFGSLLPLGMFWLLASTAAVANTPPTITPITDQTITGNSSSAALAFTIGDAETPATGLTLVATTDTPSLLPLANVVFGGSGANRTVKITPALNHFGTAKLRVRVNDPDGGSNSTLFTVTVTTVNTNPTITAIADQTLNEDTPAVIAFTIGDLETPAANLTLVATTDTPSLLPLANIVFAGSGASRTVKITPAVNRFGSAKVRVRVNDPDGGTNSALFTVTVHPINDNPTITAIANQSIEQGGSSAAIPFTIGDLETPATGLSLVATTDNPTLLPLAHIVFGGSGASRTVQITPAPGLTGTAKVRVRVNDPDGGTNSSLFTVVVTSPAMSYLYAYNSNSANGTVGLVNNWIRTAWEASDGAIATNLAAAAPGRSGQQAMEVTFGAGNSWNAIGLAHRLDWNNIYPLFLNQFRTIEFDLQFAAGSTGEDNLSFVFEDAGHSSAPGLTNLIPGWPTMSPAQKHGTWFHIIVNLADIQPNIFSFQQFLLFNGADAATSQPHFFLADVKLGWVVDAAPPVITLGTATLDTTYTQLGLTFSSDEPTLYKVDYGTSTAYGHTIQGGTTVADYAETYSVKLTGLTPGTTCTYRITATDHQFQGGTPANQGTLTGSYIIPTLPVNPPIISNLAVTKSDGCSATLGWSTDRPCSAVVTYQKSGGSLMTRSLTDFLATRSFLLDLLQPSSAYAVHVTATDAFGNVSAQATITANTTSGGTPDVTVTINPAQTKAISPYIYGLNFSSGITDAPSGVTFDRTGGNRWTAYNWENNASNAGSDYLYESDDYLGGGTTPAEAVRSIIASDQSRSQASLVTLQLQGYVAADKSGPVNLSDPNHLNRFKQVVYKKGSAFTATPSTGDASVYMDEFAWALDGKLPGLFSASPAHPTFVSLDNEPELWGDTHAEIQSGLVDPEVYIQKTIALTKALKDQFPSMITFGPVHYGFAGIVNWQGASGFSDSYWFTNKYLQELAVASNTYGKRLLDVYDIHWYSEARSVDTNQRIAGLTSATLTSGEVQAVVQSPRSLWDATYTENSWVANYFGGPVHILDRLQQKIDADWPGTKLAVTEYESGGDNHIAGAVAQADNLGIFADLGVFAASWWPPYATYPYTVGAFRAYRGFDGAGANFGDTALKTTSSNIQNVSVHTSLDSHTPGRVVFVAINRSADYQEVALTGQPLAGTATVYRITAQSGAAQVTGGIPVAPVLVGSVPVGGSSFLIVLPPLSVSTIDVK